MGDNLFFVYFDFFEVEELLEVEEWVSLVYIFCFGWIYVLVFFV